MSLIVGVVSIFVLCVWVARTRDLFVVSVRDGRVLLVRGRISTELLGDIERVVSHPRARRATIKAVAGQRNARLVSSGLDEAQAQRLRNMFGLCPVARLRSLPRVARPTLGQRLGIAWLAWLSEP